MKQISSRDNPLYKEIKLLATSSQARRKVGRTLLDGVHLCEAYLQHVGKPLLCAVSNEALAHPEVDTLIKQCEMERVQCIMLPDALHKALSQVENGIGLLFVVDTPQATMPETLTQSAIMLDNLQDPGNLGSILRSAAAAGVEYIFCSRGTAFAWSPKVLRSGMGAHFLLKIFENVDLDELIRKTKVPVLATSSHAEKLLYEVDLNRPVAWLFGHEGQGVSTELLALASHRVAIPHRGAVESLNVAASAAICLFEQIRQRTV